MHNVIMLIVAMLNVTMLSVMAPTILLNVTTPKEMEPKQGFDKFI
jgi:hypothetical protein